MGLDDVDGRIDFNGEEDVTTVGFTVGMSEGIVVDLIEGEAEGVVGMIVG